MITVAAHRHVIRVLALGVLLGTPSLLVAQAPPVDAQRFWIELGLGVSRQDPHCDGCFVKGRIGGPAASLSAGLTITPSFGIALLGRQFTEFSFDYSHDANYVIALAQYTPAAIRPLVVNVGGGWGHQHGDDPPYGDNGSGAVVAAGVALRVPSHSTFGLTLNLDVLKTVSGTVQAATGQGSSYRPILFTFGLGLNIATAGPKPTRSPHD